MKNVNNFQIEKSSALQYCLAFAYFLAILAWRCLQVLLIKKGGYY